MKNPLENFLSVRAIAFLLAAAFMSGCGKSDPFERFEVSGQVIYQGNPVEHGSVVFEPTESVGETAPTVFTQILDGTFRIEKKDGPTKGTYTVRVNGVDHSKTNFDVPPGTPVATPSLFPQYVFEAEIPAPNNELKIEVPDQPAGRRR